MVESEDQRRISSRVVVGTKIFGKFLMSTNARVWYKGHITKLGIRAQCYKREIRWEDGSNSKWEMLKSKAYGVCWFFEEDVDMIPDGDLVGAKKAEEE
jgi:hypothetical protein